MLKDKRMIYLLLTLVITIWGLVFYKIYSNFGEKKRVEKNMPLTAVKVDNAQGDSIFTLSLDYPDPFLKGSEQSTIAPILTVIQKIRNIQVVNWPLIEYHGLLTSKNESMGLLKVQRSDLLVKLGKVYFEVKIRAITIDSIFLEYQNESRWLRIIKK